MRQKYIENRTNPNVGRKYGDFALFLFKPAYLLKNVMSSCFGNARQNEIPPDFSFSCTETEIRKLLGEFHSQTRYQIQPYTGNLKFWEIFHYILVVVLY